MSNYPPPGQTTPPPSGPNFAQPGSASGGNDISAAFSYVFKDPDWVKKVIIGGLVSLVPILNFATVGYLLEQVRRSRDNRELPLPEWNNLGDYFMKGLYPSIASFLWSLPVVLIMCCWFATFFGLVGSGSDAGAGLASLSFLCLCCILPIYGLFIAALFPAFYVRYITSGQISAFWEVPQAWQLIQANSSGLQVNATSYLNVLLVYILAAAVASAVGGVTLGIGSVFAGFWAVLVFAYSLGKFAQTARGLPGALPPAQALTDNNIK